MAYNTIQILMEIEVTKDEMTSTVTSFKHYKSNEELSFGIKGMLLCDVESFRTNSIEFPKEAGKYKMRAEWDNDIEIIEDIWDIIKIQ